MNNQRTALITGATSGIGEAYARNLAKFGYDLIITGRRSEKIHSVADALCQVHNRHVEVHIVELSDSAQVCDFIEKIDCRNIDLLVNNAGFGTTKYIHQEEVDILEKLILTNIQAHVKITHALLPKMIAKGSGGIINVSSSGAFLPSPRTATYNGTKAFLHAFTESLHLELQGTGVQVQVVCPGLTRTDMPLRLGIPEEAMIDWGPFEWITPQEVVECSLSCFNKKKVVCLPGRKNRTQIRMRHFIPEQLYFKITGFFLRKYGWLDKSWNGYG